jgi:hypothetical protein
LIIEEHATVCPAVGHAHPSAGAVHDDEEAGSWTASPARPAGVDVRQDEMRATRAIPKSAPATAMKREERRNGVREGALADIGRSLDSAMG